MTRSADADAPEDSDPPFFPRGAMLLPWIAWCLILPLFAGIGGPLYAEQVKREEREIQRMRERKQRAKWEKTNATRTRKRESFNAGRMAYDNGDFPEAIEQFTLYIETHPKHVNAHWLRGLARFEVANLEAAHADFTRVIQLQSTHSYAFRSRSQVRALQGDTKGAVEDMTRSADLEPSSAYPAIWIAGLNGDTTRLLPFASSTDWISEVARYYVDRVSEQELLARASEAPTTKTQNDQLCEAFGYIGLRAERDGDTAKALFNYKRCVDTGVRNFIEYRWAQIRLQQEAGSQEAPGLELEKDSSRPR